MGRINFGPLLIDRKGITDRVTLDNMTLMDWEVFPLPMDEDDMAALKFGASAPARPGTFFRGAFELPATGDTYPRYDRVEEGRCLGQRPQPRPLLGDRAPKEALLPRAVP